MLNSMFPLHMEFHVNSRTCLPFLKLVIILRVNCIERIRFSRITIKSLTFLNKYGFIERRYVKKSHAPCNIGQCAVIMNKLAPKCSIGFAYSLISLPRLFIFLRFYDSFTLELHVPVLGQHCTFCPNSNWVENKGILSLIMKNTCGSPISLSTEWQKG